MNPYLTRPERLELRRRLDTAVRDKIIANAPQYDFGFTLTETEEIIQGLLSRGEIVSVAEMVEATGVQLSAVRSAIFTLRRKLARDGKDGIETIKHQGYRLDTGSSLR